MVNEHPQRYFSLDKTLVANLKSDLEALLKTYSGSELKAVEVTGLIIAKYSEEHRAYHNLSHIQALLGQAENFRDKFDDEESVRLAVWFHDAVYEPQSQANEIESARLAVESLTKLNFPQAKIERVEKMILATEKHDAFGLETDGKLFLDLDLGILGAGAEVYKKYAEAIRREYSFVPEKLYREKRREILESFLQRKFIYYTNELREFLEEPARINIANEIKELL
jgi:predicted metal-dependent HD superfamily phosphohydrolase